MYGCSEGTCHELGRGSSVATETPYCALDSERHETRCCSSTFIAHFEKTECQGQDLWTEAKSKSFGECQHALNYTEADTLCKSMSARLCTLAELEAGCTSGTGCGHNLDLVWSSTTGTADTLRTYCMQHTYGQVRGARLTQSSPTTEPLWLCARIERL